MALFASSRTSADLWLCRHSNSYYNHLCCCTFHMRCGRVQRSSSHLQSLALSLRKEVALSCTLFLLISLSRASFFRSAAFVPCAHTLCSNLSTLCNCTFDIRRLRGFPRKVNKPRNTQLLSWRSAPNPTFFFFLLTSTAEIRY